MPKQVQKLSYTLILIYQHLKQPVSTPKQVQKFELRVDSHLPTFLAVHQNKCSSWATRLPTFETACPHTKTSEEVELHVDSHLPIYETACQHIKTSAEVELHVDSTNETAWEHTETSAEVELHVDCHLPTFETACQHTKTSEEVELHVDCHLPTFETACQHTKTSAEVELHSFTNIGNRLSAHQNKCRSWATRWFSFTNIWNSLAVHQNKCRSWATRLPTFVSAPKLVPKLSYTLILIYQDCQGTSAEVELHVDSQHYTWWTVLPSRVFTTTQLGWRCLASNASATRILSNFRQLIRFPITVSTSVASIDCWTAFLVNSTVRLISLCQTWLEGFLISFERGVSLMTVWMLFWNFSWQIALGLFCHTGRYTFRWKR